MRKNSGNNRRTEPSEGSGGWGEQERRPSRSSSVDGESSRPFGIGFSTNLSDPIGNGATTSSSSSSSNGLPLKEMRSIEIFEHERWSRKANGWIASCEAKGRAHWCNEQGLPTQSPEEMSPPADYGWVSNWRVIKVGTKSSPKAQGQQGGGGGGGGEGNEGGGGGGGELQRYDREGWEYSTSSEKFSQADRSPRGLEKWSDRARRRKWVRMAKYKTLLGDAASVQELGKQVQEGLEGLLKGRRMVQDLLDMVGTRRDSAALRQKLFNVVDLIRHHGREVENLLKAVERDQLVGAKKMRNDLSRETRAFEDLARELERKDRAVPVPREDVSPSSATKLSSSSSVVALEGGGAAINDDDRGSSGGISAGRSSFRLSGPSAAMVQGEAVEGMYISKDAQSEMILSQMHFEDEEVVMDAIARERGEVIDQVTRSIVELRDIFQDFAHVVSEQQAGIDAVVQNTDTAYAKTEQAYNSIVKANQIQKESTCVIS